jgi:hypothetical protein
MLMEGSNVYIAYIPDNPMHDANLERIIPFGLPKEWLVKKE